VSFARKVWPDLARAHGIGERSGVRLPIALVCAALLGQAPLQCASDPDDKLRRYETPGEALYGLATQFKAKGDTKAWRTTLEYLIARYPNSRFAEMARLDLAEPSPEGGS
jgi:outer membrane protein assembly factor BamD (BamD/ComL family)